MCTFRMPASLAQFLPCLAFSWLGLQMCIFASFAQLYRNAAQGPCPPCLKDLSQAAWQLPGSSGQPEQLLLPVGIADRGTGSDQGQAAAVMCQMEWINLPADQVRNSSAGSRKHVHHLTVDGKRQRMSGGWTCWYSSPAEMTHGFDHRALLTV